jgi:hypothetical protein
MIIISLDTFFNFLNFVARVGAIIYIVHRYIMPAMHAGINTQRQTLSMLKDQQISLKESYTQVNIQMVSDAAHFEQLEEKFNIWRARVQQIQEQGAQICNQRQQEIDVRAAQRVLFLQQKQLILQQVPQLLDSATHALAQEFANSPALSKQYQEKILKHLQ